MARQTSIDAYNQIKSEGLLSRRRFQVYEIVSLFGPMTISQAIISYKKSHSVVNTGSVSTRFAELRNMGLLEELRTGKCPVTGRETIFWICTDQLPKKLVKPDRIKCTHCDGRGYFEQERFV